MHPCLTLGHSTDSFLKKCDVEEAYEIRSFSVSKNKLKSKPLITYHKLKKYMVSCVESHCVNMLAILTTHISMVTCNRL